MVNRTIARARQEYSELPGLRLTCRQAARLFGVDQAICRVVLDTLVAEHFLYVERDGTYTHQAPDLSEPLDDRLLPVMGVHHDGAIQSTDDIEVDASLVACAIKPNALVEGLDLGVAVVLASMWSHLRTPVATWSGGVLPTRGTLIVPHIERLNREQQQQLEMWVDVCRGVQVISTSTDSVFDRVVAGEFSSELFYRLNTVRIVVCPSSSLASRPPGPAQVQFRGGISRCS